MKVLDKETINDILKAFKQDDKLELAKSLKYEPDCFIYFLHDKNEKNYVLVCRDLIQDDLEAEERILKNELGIEILERIRTRSGDYWLRSGGLDDFEYIFSLNRVL